VEIVCDGGCCRWRAWPGVQQRSRKAIAIDDERVEFSMDAFALLAFLLIDVLKKTMVNPKTTRELAGKMSNEPAKSGDCGFNRGFL
jgi:hypothetical protein